MQKKNSMEKISAVMSRKCTYNDPTRGNEHRANMLDQFVSNVPGKVESTSLFALHSTKDHCTIVSFAFHFEGS